MFFKRSLEPHSLWCPLKAVAEWNHRLIVCYITEGWRDAHFQNDHAALCAGKPLHLVSQTHFHAAQSKERVSFDGQSSRVSSSEWNQMLLWAKLFRWGTLSHVISKSLEEKSNLICRGWLWMWLTMLAEGQNLNLRASLSCKSQTPAKITPPNSAKSDTTF